MFPCSLLPTYLLAVLFAFPALAAPSSANDPFRDIALQVPKKPEPDICCLRPLEPLEPSPEEDVLLSFEEWKTRRLGEAKDHVPGPHLSLSNGHKPAGVGGDNVSHPGNADTAASNDSQSTADSCHQDTPATAQIGDYLSPHSRIPIVDRFNYASTDCSATVHTAHKSAKSPSSILSSKKDRYMLSPCAEEKQFVVVELCDDIMIDTVQLANYEFFSGVFKDFTVSVAKTYTAGWTYAGTYRAQNVRGVQSFHLSTLRDFYRFIRIDFESHYGNEYYCPLSLLRVYGLTHLEQWKWDEWESQSRAQRTLEEAIASVDMHPDPRPLAHIPIAESTEPADQGVQPTVAEVTIAPSGVPSSDISSDSETVNIAITPAWNSSSDSLEDDTDGVVSRPSDMESDTITNTDEEDVHNDTPAATIPSPSPPAASVPPSSESEHDDASDSSLRLSQPTQAPRTTPVISLSSTHTASSVPLSVVPQVSPHPPQMATGGESIYRTIMNRLTALEGNTTLYARYVEEQTTGVREVLRRLGEDVGRLEGIGKAQQQMYQRSVTEFDRRRRRLEIEHIELMAKVNHLADEVVLEKRLGIAQLCLLLAVLVFMVFTRGSRGEHVHRVSGSGRPMMARDWGRRTLSLSISGDLLNRFRGRSLTPPSPTKQPPRQAEKSTATNSVEFPPQEDQKRDASSRNKNPPLHPGSSSRRLSSHQHTPSSMRVSSSRHFNMIRPPQHGASHSSPLSRPVIQRSASGGGFTALGHSSRSVKRWARSAHLHEVRGLHTVNTNAGESHAVPEGGQATPAVPQPDASNVDIFSPLSTPVVAGISSKGKGSYQDFRPALSPLRLGSARDLPKGCAREGPASDVEGSEGDGWVDTDADGSESEVGGEASGSQ